LDELHEMKINKEAKRMLVRLTEDNMSRISSSLPFRAKMMENFIIPRKDQTDFQTWHNHQSLNHIIKGGRDCTCNAASY